MSIYMNFNIIPERFTINEIFEVEDQHQLWRSQYIEIIGNRIIYSYANQHLFNHANGEDRHFKEFSNFISIQERRGSLKSCDSIKSSLSHLVEERNAFKSSCSHDWNRMIFEWKNEKKDRKEMAVSNYSNCHFLLISWSSLGLTQYWMNRKNSR